MININLIVKPAPRVNWRRLALVTVTGAAAAALGVYSVSWWGEWQQVKDEAAALEPLAETYRKVIASGGNIKDREAAVQKQEERLTQMGRNQVPGGQAEVLKAVFAVAPADVMLTEVSLDKDGLLLLIGQAPAFDMAMAYLKALQQLPVLTDVKERKLITPAKGTTTFTFAGRVRREGVR